MKRVLLTGGQGLLGSSIAKALLEGGNEVVATRRNATDNRRETRMSQSIEWVVAELTREDALQRVKPCDALIHTAAVLPDTHDQSGAAAASNRRIDEVILQTARRWQASLLYASSVAVYEDMQTPIGGLVEDNSPRPRTAYAAEKAWAEQQGRAQSDAGHHQFTALRISAPYGPRQRTKTVLRLFVERAWRGEPLLYWGQGMRQQDFIHAEDVARAFGEALARPGGTFNIASGQAITMRELAEVVAGAAGLSASAVKPAGHPDPGEERRVAYSTRLASRALDWGPLIALPAGVGGWLECLRKAA